jgi:negative regulator of sigma E activity
MVSRSQKRLLLFATLLLVLLLQPLLSRAEDIEHILTKMREANSSVQYRGVLTTVFLNTPFTKVYQYQVANYANGHRREEFLTTGQNKEINFDDGNYLWRFFPNKRLLIKERSRVRGMLTVEPQNNLELLRQNYEIGFAEEHVEDRAAYKISFQPKLANRPLQIYWIDGKTGVPLKIERYGPRNTLLSVSSFSAIDFQPYGQENSNSLMVPPMTALSQVDERGNLCLNEAENLMQTKLLTPSYLPNGFALRNVALRTQASRKTIQFFYTDGLSAISVFQRIYDPRDVATPFDKQDKGIDEPSLHTTGTLNIIRLRSNQLRITLLGDVFREELLKVAKSIAPIPASNPFQESSPNP